MAIFWHDFLEDLMVRISYETSIFQGYIGKKEQRKGQNDIPDLEITKSVLLENFDTTIEIEKSVQPVDCECFQASVSGNSLVVDTTNFFYLRNFGNPYVIDEEEHVIKVSSYNNSSITLLHAPYSSNYYWTSFYFFPISMSLKSINDYYQKINIVLKKIKE